MPDHAANGNERLSKFYQPDNSTKVIHGQEAVSEQVLLDLPLIKRTFDLCGDSNGPTIILACPTVYEGYQRLAKRGVKVRQITEITKENLPECRKMMEFSEVRHLDGLKGYFGIADSNIFASFAFGEPDKTPPYELRSTVKEFVEQQKYFYETLWNKAIPADRRIKELEGVEPEVTEIWQGMDSAYSRAVNLLKSVNKTHDVYVDKNGPFLMCSQAEAFKEYNEIHARGGKIRLITEITPDNIQYCKQLANLMDIRHVDNVRGNFRILDSRIYGATPKIQADESLSYLHSTVREFVELQQYFFDTLWNNALPSSSRFAEIDFGKRPQRIEIIHDGLRARQVGFDVLQRTKRELLVLFSDSSALSAALELGAIEVYHELTQKGVVVKILVATDPRSKEILDRVKSIAPSVNSRVSKEVLDLEVTILISDRSELITWEVKEEDKSDLLRRNGIATYTTIETLSRSYAVIFDNLWKSTEYADMLQASNLNLQNKEQAMQEFMELAAHELRNPIQPVLGLSERLQEEGRLDAKHQHYLEIIVRNAKRLQRLQQDILDVTRIDSRMFILHKERINLHTLLNEVSANFQHELFSKGIELAISCPDNISLIADKEKLLQVIGNILSNAIKATEAKGLAGTRRSEKAGNEHNYNSISISAVPNKTEQGDMQFVEINVTDHGTGIASDMIPRLFTKFATNSPTGTGLGLYISKAIVEAHGGKIWARNNSDVGATFGFGMPI